MPSFTYSAINAEDKYTKNRIEARSQKKAIAALEAQGLLVVNIRREQHTQWWDILYLSTVRRIDKITFTRHVHTLLESGIAIDQALKISSEQTTNVQLKKVAYDLHLRVKKGEFFHVALSNHRQYFSPFFINLVRIGEKSGTLDEVLEHLLEQQERDYELLTKARGALIYPAIIISAAIAIVVLMMTFVIPNITALLLEYNVELPLTTRIIIGISSFLNRFGIVTAIVVLVMAAGVQRWIKRPRGKQQWDWIKLHIPIIKNITVEFNMARICRSMSAMLKSGVSIDEALKLSATVCSNSYYERSLLASVDIVRKGIPITEVLHGYPELYPVMSTRMIEIGGKTGKYDLMFTRLAIFYEKSVMTTIQNMSSIIEPVMLLLIGAGVGFIAVSILTPIWRFAQTI